MNSNVARGPPHVRKSQLREIAHTSDRRAICPPDWERTRHQLMTMISASTVFPQQLTHLGGPAARISRRRRYSEAGHIGFAPGGTDTPNALSRNEISV